MPGVIGGSAPGGNAIEDRGRGVPAGSAGGSPGGDGGREPPVRGVTGGSAPGGKTETWHGPGRLGERR